MDPTVRIDDLIVKLKAIRERHGNIPVVIEDDHDGLHDIWDPEIIKANPGWSCCGRWVSEDHDFFRADQSETVVAF